MNSYQSPQEDTNQMVDQCRFHFVMWPQAFEADKRRQKIIGGTSKHSENKASIAVDKWQCLAG